MKRLHKNSFMSKVLQLFRLGLMTTIATGTFSCVHDPNLPEIESVIIKSTPFNEVKRIQCGPRPDYREQPGDPDLKFHSSLYLTDIKENPFDKNQIAMVFETLIDDVYVYIFDLASGKYRYAYSGNALGRMKWLGPDKIVIDGIAEILVIDINSSKVIFKHSGFRAQTNPALGYFSFQDRSGWMPQVKVYTSDFELVDELSLFGDFHLWHPTKPIIYKRTVPNIITYNIENRMYDTVSTIRPPNYSNLTHWSEDLNHIITLDESRISFLAPSTGQMSTFIDGCNFTISNRGYHSITYISSFNSYVVSEHEWKLNIEENAVYWKLNWYRVDVNGEFIDKVEFRIPDELKGKL